jgi:hypothetical protein
LQEHAFAEFCALDTEGSGSLEPSSCVALARRLLGRRATPLARRDAALLLTHMRTADPDGDGRLTFNELLVQFRAVPIVLPRGAGRITTGYDVLQAPCGHDWLSCMVCPDCPDLSLNDLRCCRRVR